MKRLVLILIVVLGGASAASAQTGAFNGYCTLGAQPAVTSGLKSSNTLQGLVPSCTVTVYLTGTTTLAQIYSNGSDGSLPNPFTANTDGSWLFYAATSTGYDVKMSGGDPVPVSPFWPKTLTDLQIGGGGGGSPGLPFYSLQYNSAGSFGGANATFNGNFQFGGIEATPVSTYTCDGTNCTFIADNTFFAGENVQLDQGFSDACMQANSNVVVSATGLSSSQFEASEPYPCTGALSGTGGNASSVYSGFTAIDSGQGINLISHVPAGAELVHGITLCADNFDGYCGAGSDNPANINLYAEQGILLQSPAVMIGSVSTGSSAEISSDNGLEVIGGPSTAGAVQFYAGAAPPAVATNTVQIAAPATVTAYGVVLPSAQGTGALTNSGSGNLSWVSSLPLAGGTMNTNAAIAFQGTGAATTLANLGAVSLSSANTFTAANTFDSTAQVLGHSAFGANATLNYAYPNFCNAVTGFSCAPATVAGLYEKNTGSGVNGLMDEIDYSPTSALNSSSPVSLPLATDLELDLDNAAGTSGYTAVADYFQMAVNSSSVALPGAGTILENTNINGNANANGTFGIEAYDTNYGTGTWSNAANINAWMNNLGGGVLTQGIGFQAGPTQGATGSIGTYIAFSAAAPEISAGGTIGTSIAFQVGGGYTWPFYNSESVPILSVGGYAVGTTGAHVTVIPSTASGSTGTSSGYVPLVPGPEATGYATLSSGTVTVSNAAACIPSATCIYKLTNCGVSGTTTYPGYLTVGATTPGTSFVINSVTSTAGAVLTTDTSKVCWQIN